VGLGHAVGGHFMDRARSIFPVRESTEGGILPIANERPRAEEGLFYLDGMGNAANFAFANRLFLGLMALRANRGSVGARRRRAARLRCSHNLVFRSDSAFIHRK